MHSLQSIGVSVSNSWAAAHFPRRSFALNPESPLICWSSLTIDLICSVTNSCAASSLTFRRKSQRIVSTSFSLQRVRKSWLNLPSSLPVLEIDLAFFMKCDFHDCDKMPKHVEMIRTKCQPKSWDGQNANHRNKSGQNANLWLALCPVGILSGWHFVRTPSALISWFQNSLLSCKQLLSFLFVYSIILKIMEEFLGTEI